MIDINNFIFATRKVCQHHFENLASKTNIDKGKTMIVFLSKILHTRIINNWGREEDTDMFVGIDENGWVIYKHDIQHSVGPVEISNTDTKSINDNELMKLVESEDFTDKDRLDFMEKCINIRTQYESQFDEYYLKQRD